MKKERFKESLSKLSKLVYNITKTAASCESHNERPTIDYLVSIGHDILSIREELVDAIYEETHDEHVVDVLKDVRDRIDHLIKREEL